jgi:hypothetical protein
MFYAVYDETGRIVQGNKIYFPEVDYEKAAGELGHKFVKRGDIETLSPDEWWVRLEKIKKRPSMLILVSATKIKAGGVDFAVLRGAPQGAKLDVTAAGGLSIFSGAATSEIEIDIPVPCTYRVQIELWPYKTFIVEIEALP